MAAHVERRGEAQAGSDRVGIAPGRGQRLQRPHRLRHHRHQQQVDRGEQLVERAGDRYAADAADAPVRVPDSRRPASIRPASTGPYSAARDGIGLLVRDGAFDGAERHPVARRPRRSPAGRATSSSVAPALAKTCAAPSSARATVVVETGEIDRPADALAGDALGDGRGVVGHRQRHRRRVALVGAGDRRPARSRSRARCGTSGRYGRANRRAGRRRRG